MYLFLHFLIQISPQIIIAMLSMFFLPFLAIIMRYCVLKLVLECVILMRGWQKIYVYSFIGNYYYIWLFLYEVARESYLILIFFFRTHVSEKISKEYLVIYYFQYTSGSFRNIFIFHIFAVVTMIRFECKILYPRFFQILWIFYWGCQCRRYCQRGKH